MAKFKIFQVIILFVVILSVVSCRQASKGPEILTTKIQYDVPIVSGDPQLDWWINNIEGSRREPFLKRILEAAEKGEVKVFDYFNNPMSPQQVLAMGTDTIFQTLMRVYPPYEEYDTMIISSITYRDIKKIRFMEEWTWDPAGVTIEKKVIGLGPVIEREVAGETFNQLLFWIYFNKDLPK